MFIQNKNSIEIGQVLIAKVGGIAVNCVPVILLAIVIVLMYLKVSCASGCIINLVRVRAAKTGVAAIRSAILAMRIIKSYMTGVAFTATSVNESYENEGEKLFHIIKI